jgi:[ribosomal protein S5]-alanine N-acetyltransferase
VIRPLVPEDAEELTALLVANRGFTRPFDPDRDDRFYTVAFQERVIRERANLYGILDGEAIAGTIALSNVVHGAFRSANLGYWVDEARNGRGLATAAVRDVVERIAFGELGLHRVEAGTLVANVGSQRVLEKNRFTRIGLAPRYLHIGGAWQDHILFQRTVED